MLWRQHGGHGDDVCLLLHGLGATGAVWDGVCHEIDRAGRGQWLVVDLPGHGDSQALTQYSVGALAGAVAAELDREASYRAIGHSLGVYVAIALASGWFGVRVSSVLGIGPKVTWTDADLSVMAELARKPSRVFTDEGEAWARYRKVSGLDARVAPGMTALARGIASTQGGFRLAAAPGTALAAGAPFATLVRSARCPVRLARGETDAMVSLDELRQYCADASDIAAAGHNAHVEAPARIVELAASIVGGLAAGQPVMEHV
jgi:pimeloyl-ACP methyl ester carboxylesterase